MSSCDLVNMSTCQHVNMSTCQHVNMSTCQHVIMLSCQHIMSLCQHVIMSSCQHIMSSCHYVTSCKAHKLEIDQLKSWQVDQLSSVKLAMIKISDPWVQEWRPWEGSVDQLDIGKSDINDTEVKLVLNTVHNFKGDLKHSKWGPQTFKIGTQFFWSKLVESL